LAEEGKDYSDYVGMLSSLIGGLYFVAGFTFTAVTLLLTQVSGQSGIFYQVILFLMSVLIDLSIFLASWYTLHTTMWVKIPLITKGFEVANFLTFIVASLVSVITPLLFFFYGLFYVGFASLVVWILEIFSAYLFLWQPNKELRARMHHQTP